MRNGLRCGRVSTIRESGRTRRRLRNSKNSNHAAPNTIIPTIQASRSFHTPPTSATKKGGYSNSRWADSLNRFYLRAVLDPCKEISACPADPWRNPWRIQPAPVVSCTGGREPGRRRKPGVASIRAHDDHCLTFLLQPDQNYSIRRFLLDPDTDDAELERPPPPPSLSLASSQPTGSCTNQL